MTLPSQNIYIKIIQYFKTYDISTTEVLHICLFFNKQIPTPPATFYSLKRPLS